MLRLKRSVDTEFVMARLSSSSSSKDMMTIRIGTLLSDRVRNWVT